MADEKKLVRSGRSLDAVRDLKHWSYRIPGMAVWTSITVFVFLMFPYPYLALEIARLLGFYTLIRLIWVVVFYLVGLVRLKRKQHEVEHRGPNWKLAPELKRIHHIVVIPNFKEPIDVLTKTLQALSRQENARTQLTVVLAMEASDPSCESTSSHLSTQFKDCFERILVTIHPSMKGEPPGKAANQTWAARIAKNELVDRLGIPLDSLTITSCDADSILHPAYFSEISRLFVSDPGRHECFWQAPLFFDSNIWEVPSSVRLMTFLTNTVQLSELSNPLAFPMPYSTYTLSLKLAVETGYWDTNVMAEDWHMYLRCFFSHVGRPKLVPLFLPTLGMAVTGENLLDAWKNFYNRQVRLSWGGQDIAYIIQQWDFHPSPPLFKKFERALKMVNDHLIFSAYSIIAVLGTVLSFVLNRDILITFPGKYNWPVFVATLNFLGVLALWVMWGSERLRSPSHPKKWTVAALAGDLVAISIMPMALLVLTAIPFLHAQTKLMMASPLEYKRTPKEVSAPYSPRW